MSLYCHDVLRVISHTRGAEFLQCVAVYNPSLARDFPHFVSIFARVCDLLGLTIDTTMSRAVPDTLS